jgi:hypothetical protein
MRLLASLLLLTVGLNAQTITIAPAPVDRAALIVRVPLYPFIVQRNLKRLCAFDAAGKIYPLQEENMNPQFRPQAEMLREMERMNVENAAIAAGQTPQDPVRHLILVLGFVPANKTTSLDIRENDNPGKVLGNVKGQDGVTMSIDGREVLNYRTDKKRKPRPEISDDILRAGYLHPVRSPSGAIVTGDYPANHPHHHGIWTPYTKAIFQGRTTDFWNMQNKKGRVDGAGYGFGSLFGKPGDACPVYEKLDAMTGMVDLTGPKETTALWDSWSLRLYDIPDAPKPMHVFDLTTEQACATNDPLELPQYHYGSFGLRGPEAWDGKDGARFLTSEGITDRKKGDGTRARWCYLGGKTSAGLSGTALLGFPDNFRFPMPLRLHPDMPYFSIVPQKLGPFSIEPGKPYVTRYRFVVTDGEPDAKLFDACWNSLAHPAVVKVGK